MVDEAGGFPKHHVLSAVVGAGRETGRFVVLLLMFVYMMCSCRQRRGCYRTARFLLILVLKTLGLQTTEEKRV